MLTGVFSELGCPLFIGNEAGTGEDCTKDREMPPSEDARAGCTLPRGVRRKMLPNNEVIDADGDAGSGKSSST